MFVVADGSLNVGFTYYGPFNTENEAIMAALALREDYTEETCTIIPLVPLD